MACLMLWEGDREKAGGGVGMRKLDVEEKAREPDEITRWID